MNYRCCSTSYMIRLSSNGRDPREGTAPECVWRDCGRHRKRIAFVPDEMDCVCLKCSTHHMLVLFLVFSFERKYTEKVSECLHSHDIVGTR
jgi:hypothetical protein